MSLEITLQNAISGLQTAKQSLQVISNNVANVNTEGYTRKIIEPTSRVISGIGFGVELANATRNVDAGDAPFGISLEPPVDHPCPVAHGDEAEPVGLGLDRGEPAKGGVIHLPLEAADEPRALRVRHGGERHETRERRVQRAARTEAH